VASGKSENRSLPGFWIGLLAAALAIFGMRLIDRQGERISRHYATPVAAA
jgi:hypothetical protein